MLMEVLHEDSSEGNAKCSNHPFKNSSPQGGICAFCLQEKLQKLVSSSSSTTSSFPSTVFPSSSDSSSSSPFFRSDSIPTITVKPSETTARRSRIPFPSGHKTNKNRMESLAMGKMTNFPTSDSFIRSKSTTSMMSFLDDEDNKSSTYYSPRSKRGFWSFLHSPKHPINQSRKADGDSHRKDSNFTPTTPASSCVSRRREKKREESMEVFDEDDDGKNTYDRKVSRSKSVGCGSTRFSNDLLERISNGFGDCALRRVESHREGNKTAAAARKSCVGMIGHDFIRERVGNCGGIFSGFAHVSSSSPSSSSSFSSYVGGKLLSTSAASHGRSKSWGWALASPMRAFGKKNSSSSSSFNNVKNRSPNLADVPSILSVSGSVGRSAYA